METLTDVTGHFNVLNLVATYRNLMRVEHQDVGSHQHRVAVQSHGDACIRVFATFHVLVHRRLVGVGAIEQALGRDAGEQPGQFRDFRNVRLAIEGHTIDVQPRRQPGRCDFQTRALNPQRVIAFDQRVVVGQKVERVEIALTAGDNGRANRARVVAQMGSAGGRDTGQDTSGHGRSLINRMQYGLQSAGKSRQEQIFQISQLAVKKVSAFCHFQQLMGTLQRGGPCIDRLRVDHFVVLRLNDRQRASLGQYALVLEARRRSRNQKQMRELFTLRFQPATQVCSNVAAKGKSEQGHRHIWMLRPQPLGGSLGIIDLARPGNRGTGTGTDAAIIEAQRDQTLIACGTLQRRDDFIEHRSALYRVRMTDQCNTSGVGDILIQRFELAFRAIDK
ncbi:hypothetical protein ALQ20_05443 [Pseudomonas syringae pv. atrofaciens]|nr:hypothetical protein ALQ20_05443 [Pseudomonas syringae pv. atrofaciens]